MVVGFQAAETIAVLASTVAILIGLFVLVEKISGVTGRWAAKQVSVGVEPLKEDIASNNEALVQHQEWSIEQMALDHKCIEDRLAKMSDYERYHLGPNGTATPIHQRISELEKGMQLISATESERKRFENFIDNMGIDIKPGRRTSGEDEG